MLKEVKELKMSELDQYLFGQGNHYDIYKKLGAHPAIKDGKEGVWFAVWAPNARYISVVGNFNRLGQRRESNGEDGNRWNLGDVYSGVERRRAV